jgi:beta-mannosidase
MNAANVAGQGTSLRQPMDLSGAWRAVTADEHLRRAFPDPDLDDGGWEQVVVPGHWRSAPAFAGNDGPVLHRRRFEAPVPVEGRRAWLTFDGLFYQGDVWLDGSYLGDTEGYFFPHTFEVTDALRDRSEHLLAVEVTCAPQRDRTAKRNLTGVFQHWDCLDPDWNPGGIWRPVQLTETGPVRIARLRAVCREATDRRAVLDLHATLDADAARTVALRTTLGGTDDVTERSLAAGPNDIGWTLTIEQPTLWWPRALGDPVLHDLTVEVAVTGDGADGSGAGAVSDRRTVRTGLRQVRMRDWITTVNGERLFLKGSNQGPTRMALGEATPEELRRDVELAVETGLDLLRVHAHVSRPELYEAADEAGVLLWQDMPLQWGYARGVRKQAVRQARALVDLLGHHPSIAIWCGHNEPMAIDVEPGALEERRAMVSLAIRAGAAQQLPTWNKSVLDRSIKRALDRADGTRPTIAHSGILPHLPLLDGTDSHLYFGWYWGDERSFPGFCRTVPRMARFVSEFGAQAVPRTAGFCEPERWPDLDWERLERTHALQRSILDRYVPEAEHGTFDAWREATQRYQATVVKHHVEHLRRLKYRPTGGFAHFCFADGHPAITWSVLDHERVPKAAHAALAEACRPVIVVADRLPSTLTPGGALALDVHVVSDLRVELTDAVVTARLAWDGGEHRWRWQGTIGADSCVRVATLAALVPDAGGTLALELVLEHPDAGATNRYEARILPDSGSPRHAE